MMLTSIVILQILIKTKGELGEANRAASVFKRGICPRELTTGHGLELLYALLYAF